MAENEEFFYADEVPIAFTNPVWIQWSFGVVIGLFERLCICTNMVNMVEMVCQPGPIKGRKSVAAYGR